MRRGSDHPHLWLELAAALLVPAAVLGFSRVFDSFSALIPILAGSLLSTVIAVTCRRFKLPLALSGLISALALLVVVVNRFAPGTAIAGVIPTGQSQVALRQLFDQLLVDFQELESPVPGLDPFIAAAMIGAWIMAFLTDWGALRLRLAFEPVLPSALLFVFASIPPISAQQNRIFSSIIFASSIALWAVAQRTSAISNLRGWLRGDRRSGPIALARSGIVFAALAVALGAWLGPHLPGAKAEPVYSLANQQDSTRKVVSPYVQLHQRIVEQSDVELFQVTSAEPAYWRIAGLDLYEDEIWRLAGDFSRENGDLPSATPLGGQRVELQQTYEIEALGAIWLPAAFAPTKIIESTASTTWHAETSTLTVDGSTVDGDGVVYTIDSSLADIQASDLIAAPPTAPAEITEHYLVLPPMPTILEDTASAVTAGSNNQYEQMMALQTFFRNEFAYEVKLSDSGSDPITQFLTERQGFCQQFAGTFALMARYLGVPARVATGFTWGDKIETASDGRDVYQVTGAQAHAWPEIYFEGIGWVAFEPTPGRGIPRADYADTPPSQSSQTQPTLPEEIEAPAPEEQVTPSTQPPDAGAESSMNLDAGGSTTSTTSTTLPEDETEEPGPSLFDYLKGLFRFLLYSTPLLLVAAYLIGIPILAQAMKRRRRAHASSPADHVNLSWTEATETLAFGFGIKRQPAETSAEFAQRLVERHSAGSGQMTELASLSTKARYHARGITKGEAARSESLASEVEQAMTDRVDWWVRYRRSLDPRRLPGLAKTVWPTTKDEPPDEGGYEADDETENPVPRADQRELTRT